MEVILLERIEKLGQMGDIVKVKPGFARNYLLPQAKALRSNKENLALFEARKIQLEAANLKRREEAELRNKAEAFINQIDSTLADAGDKIDAKQKEETLRLRDELQKALDDNDMEAVKTKLDALEKAAQMASEQMYQQQGASGNAQQSNNNDDNIVDADFTEKN